MGGLGSGRPNGGGRTTVEACRSEAFESACVAVIDIGSAAQ